MRDERDVQVLITSLVVDVVFVTDMVVVSEEVAIDVACGRVEVIVTVFVTVVVLEETRTGSVVVLVAAQYNRVTVRVRIDSITLTQLTYVGYTAGECTADPLLYVFLMTPWGAAARGSRSSEPSRRFLGT